MASGLNFVQAFDSCGVRGLQKKLGLILSLFGDGFHGFNKEIEFLLALGLRRLDHEGAWHDQRECDRRGVKAVVHQALRNVHDTDMMLSLFLIGENNFVQDRFIVGQIVNAPQLMLDVVGIQNCH